MIKALLFALLAYVLISFDDVQTIVAGVAIFIVGMLFMEDGFKAFSGGALQEVLGKWTDKVPKAIFTGFATTAVVQSSSLISLITISFLSAELITLSQGVGIIFGSNIGTTATSWIVSTFGVKIKIAHYAMPILIFGVLFKFMKSKTYRGLGDVLLGLGFIFLGIGFMKEGFETLKEGIDLAQFHIDGFLGIFTYILVGAVATVIVQSSSATMAIIIVAIANNQILYIDAIALAIGSNIGTTVTAVIGSLTSGANGKRLALAHLIFNMITGFFAIALIYQLMGLVDVLSVKVGIADDDYAMKLTLFHTIFNLMGVMIVSPFIHPLVRFLEGRFNDDSQHKSGEPKYLDSSAMETSLSATTAIRKESEHLYKNSLEIIVHGLSLHRKDIFSDKSLEKIMESSTKPYDIDIDRMYQVTVKNLYGDIIRFATMANDTLSRRDSKYIYSLKIANRGVVRAIKDIEKVQDNFNIYINHANESIRNEYNFLRKKIVTLLRELRRIENMEADFTEAILTIEVLKDNMKDIDIVENGRIDELIRDQKIDSKMTTSLINDSIYIYNVSNRLLEFAETVWADNEILREYDEDLETKGSRIHEN
jgi:phosphate:Na+ symporter